MFQKKIDCEFRLEGAWAITGEGNRYSFEKSIFGTANENMFVFVKKTLTNTSENTRIILEGKILDNVE